jgi:hypothetical protein
MIFIIPITVTILTMTDLPTAIPGMMVTRITLTRLGTAEPADGTPFSGRRRDRAVRWRERLSRAVRHARPWHRQIPARIGGAVLASGLQAWREVPERTRCDQVPFVSDSSPALL